MPTSATRCDYPAAVGNRMTNTNSSVFINLGPLDPHLRENERRMQNGAGWNPHYHQATDRPPRSYSTRTSGSPSKQRRQRLGAMAQLTGATFEEMKPGDP